VKIGVCCFDDINDAEYGWASISGGEAQRVSGPNELDSSIPWVTNLPYMAHKKLNMGASGNILDEQYFRTKISQIGLENGIDSDKRALAEFASLIFQKVADLGLEHFGIDMTSPGYRYHKTASYNMIPAYARNIPEDRNSAEIVEAIDHSTQANQAMFGVKRPKGSSAVSLGFPRQAYGKWILSQPLPAGGSWKKVRQKDNSTTFGFENGYKLRNTSAVLERLMEHGKNNAMFLRVQVRSMDPFYRNFAGFGAGEKDMRRWASLPEIIELSRYAKISIEGGYMCPLSSETIVDEAVFGDSDISYARGLLVENAWAALASPVTVQSGSRSTMIGAYMRAYDRIACGRIAASLARKGLVVGSYSMGRVVVFLRPGESQKIANTALEEGLIPPMGYLNDIDGGS